MVELWYTLGPSVSLFFNNSIVKMTAALQLTRNKNFTNRNTEHAQHRKRVDVK